jgi:hypothetical protein
MMVNHRIRQKFLYIVMVMFAATFVAAQHARSMPISAAFLGDAGFRLNFDFDSEAKPLNISPSFTDVITLTQPVPGIAEYPAESSELTFNDITYTSVFTNTQTLGLGAPGSNLFDTLTVQSVFQRDGGIVISTTVRIVAPAMSLFTDLFTQTVFINDDPVIVFVPEPYTMTSVIDRALALGSGIYQVETGGSIITGTIRAVVDGTQNMISEPSSLLIAMGCFVLLGVIARRRRMNA